MLVVGIVTTVTHTETAWRRLLKSCTIFTLCFRVFKKSAPNNKLTLYLSSRDLVVSHNKIDRLQGVILVDPDNLQDRKVSTLLYTEQH